MIVRCHFVGGGTIVGISEEINSYGICGKDMCRSARPPLYTAVSHTRIYKNLTLTVYILLLEIDITCLCFE